METVLLLKCRVNVNHGLIQMITTFLNVIFLLFFPETIPMAELNLRQIHNFQILYSVH